MILALEMQRAQAKPSTDLGNRKESDSLWSIGVGVGNLQIISHRIAGLRIGESTMT